MLRLVCTLAAVLLTASIAGAEYAVGYTEDGYSYSGQNLWAKGDTLYTRTYHEYPGYQTYYRYGYAYQKPVTYWYYSYAPQLSPKSSDADWIAWARGREKDAAVAALEVTRQSTFMERLAKFGISPPPPGIDVPAFSTYGKSAYAALTGSTIYGYQPPASSYYSFSQHADFYGAYDPALTQQGGMALAKELTTIVGRVNSDVNALAERDAQRSERLQQQRIDGEHRLQAQRIEGEMALKRFELSRPPNRVTTTITGTNVEPAFMPKVGVVPTLPPLPPADPVPPPAVPPVAAGDAAGDGQAAPAAGREGRPAGPAVDAETDR